MSTILILCCAMVSGQMLAPKIIAAVSDYFVHHGHELNWNPGEAIAETFMSEQIQTRTGYNQPVTDIIAHMNNEAQAGLYQPYVFPGQEKPSFATLSPLSLYKVLLTFEYRAIEQPERSSAKPIS